MSQSYEEQKHSQENDAGQAADLLAPTVPAQSSPVKLPEKLRQDKQDGDVSEQQLTDNNQYGSSILLGQSENLQADQSPVYSHLHPVTAQGEVKMYQIGSQGQIQPVHLSSQILEPVSPIVPTQNAEVTAQSQSALEQQSIDQLNNQPTDSGFKGHKVVQAQEAQVQTAPQKEAETQADHRILKPQTLQLDQNQGVQQKQMAGLAGMNVKAVNRHHALQAAQRKASLELSQNQQRADTGERLDLSVQAQTATYAERSSKKRDTVYNKSVSNQLSKTRQKDISNSQKLIKYDAGTQGVDQPSPMPIPPHTGSVYEGETYQSPPITATGTDFLPGTKVKQKQSISPSVNLQGGPGFPRSNFISGERIQDKINAKSLSNNERAGAQTGKNDEFNQSTDLDQVHQRHFNEYLASRTKTPQRQRNEYEQSPHTEVKSAGVSGQDSLNKLPSNDNSGEMVSPPRSPDYQQDVQAQWQEATFVNHGRDYQLDSLNATGTPLRIDNLGAIQRSIATDQPSTSMQESISPEQPFASARVNKKQRERDRLLDEVRENHFGQVQKVVGAYLKERVTANTIESTEDQMKKRIITNSYNPIRHQMRSVSPANLRAQAGGQAVRTQLPPHLEAHKLAGQTEKNKHKRNYSEVVSKSIQPKAQVQVPKDLLIMQIAKKQNQLSQKNKVINQVAMLQDSLIGSTIDKPNESPFQLPAITGPQTTRARHNSSINTGQGVTVPDVKNSYLDNIQQSVNDSASVRNKFDGTNMSRSQQQKQRPSQDPLLQDLSIFQSVPPNASTAIGPTDAGNSYYTSDILPPMTQGQSLSFHITDLLKQSISVPRERNNCAATIEYYKRSVKTTDVLDQRKEIIIKNYRLRVVDANKDLTEKDRKVMKLNKGTSIYVSNSLVKPEIYRFSTKVSNMITEAFPDMLDDESRRGGALLSAQDFESLTFHDQVQVEEEFFDKYGITQESDKELIKGQQVLQSTHGENMGAPGDFIESMEPEQDEFTTKPMPASQQQDRMVRVEQQEEDDPADAAHKYQPVPILPQEHRDRIKTSEIQGPKQMRDSEMASRVPRSSIYSYKSPTHISDGTQGTLYEQEELRAIKAAEHLYDKWIRQLKTAYTAPVIDPHRPSNSYGVDIQPTIKDINFSIMKQEGRDVVLKHKQLPIEKMTAITRLHEKPYQPLMRTIVSPEVRRFHQDFLAKTSRYIDKNPNLPTHMQSIIQVMNPPTVMRAIKFSREQLTHLDPQLVQDQNMHPDLFMNTDWVQELKSKLKEYDEKLAMSKVRGSGVDKPQPITGTTDYVFPDGVKRRIPIEVIGYERESGRFNFVNKKENINSMTARIYIHLDDDHPQVLEDAMRQTISLRAEAMQYMRLTRLIQNELLQRYEHIALTEEVRGNIYAKIGLDLARNRARTVNKVILQVEALYVYAVLKSTLSSQRDDPFIKSMLLNFKVHTDSPALEIQKQTCIEASKLQGIKQFKMMSVRQDLDRNSVFLSSPALIKLPEKNRLLAQQAVGDNRLFNEVFDIPKLIYAGGKIYAKQNIEEVKRKISVYPLDHLDWIQAQKVVAKYFNSLVKTKWADMLGYSIYNTLADGFDFSTTAIMTEEDVDPQLMKIFNQIKQFQQMLIFKAFEDGLRDYMKFLIGFAYRNEEIKKSAVINTIRKTDCIILTKIGDSENNRNSSVPNDLELCPRFSTAMIKVTMILTETGKGPVKKKKIITTPDCNDITEEMFKIVSSMHSALKEIKRCESVVLPQLKLRNPFLQRPDLNINLRLKQVSKLIYELLKECTKGAERSMRQFNKHISIFETKPENIILELKKKSFALANEGEEESDKEDGKGNGAGEGAPAPPVHEDTQESAPGSEDEDDSDEGEGGGNYQQNNMAFKSVEINESLMREQLFSIRAHKWRAMEDMSNHYDYGLLHVDCQPLKEEIVNHCEDLCQTLEKYVKNEFLDKMKNIKGEINLVTGRLHEKAESIDEVMSLLDYIETLKNKNDTKVDDIQDYINIMAKQMRFIDSLKIALNDNDYTEFLNIRNWPRSFDKFVNDRRAELQSQKSKLITEMKEQTTMVLIQVSKFKDEINEVKKRGILKLTVKEREEREKMLADLFQGLSHKTAVTKPENQKEKKSKQELEAEQQAQMLADQFEIPQFASFEWLANETGFTKKRFDPHEIEKAFDATEKLKVRFDEVNALKDKINERESLLGEPRTSFAELKKINDDLKPLYELWAVASRFNSTVPLWFEGQFSGIESGELENTVEEWIIELKRLQKTQLIEKNKKQAELLQFMQEVLQYFKKYFPMIKTLRTRGLALRHWREIGKQLGFSIDPASVSLFKIIALKLYEDDKLRIIKNISDIAQKEFAVSQALEALDREMKGVEFEFETAPDNETKLTKGIPDIMSRFEEFHLRTNVLKTNPHIRNFNDKLIEIEKTVKNVTELLEEWQAFQRNWLYLNGIFAKSEISKSLNNELKLFSNLDNTYKLTMRGILAAPQVFRIAQREGFLTTLKKQNTDAETVRSGLHIFLGMKRDTFPRLYFISNEELIDIFGRADEIIDHLVQGKSQAFLQSLFEGVDSLRVNPQARSINGMCSKLGELIPFQKSVNTMGSPEQWLQQLEKAMVNEMKYQVFYSYEDMDMDLPTIPTEKRDFGKFMQTKISHERFVKGKALRHWVKKWPGQCIYLSQQIWFTEKLQSIFQSAIERKEKIAADKQRKLQKSGEEIEQAVDSDASEDEYASVALSEEDIGNVEAVETKVKVERDEEDEDDDAENEGENAETESAKAQRELEEAQARQREKQNEEEQREKERAANTIELTMQEKVMRLRERYLVNPTKHPGYQILDVRKTCIQKTLLLSQMLKKKVSNHVRSNVISLITILVYHRDLADQLKRDMIFRQTDFGWQIVFKFGLKNVEEALEAIEFMNEPVYDAKNPKCQTKIKTANIDAQLAVLSTSIDYGFEYLGNQPRLVITPLTERCQRSLLVALQYQYGGAPEGPFGTGKTETTKDLGRALAKLCFVQNASGQVEFDNMMRFFKGICSSGAWVVFDEFNRLQPLILTFLSQIIIQIQNAIRKRQSTLALHDNPKLQLNFNAAVFITLNPGYAGRTELPMDLKNLFRSISMVVPDATFITEILLFSAGFKNAQELAKKVISVQNLANILMAQSSVVKFDFGLRAIKAIVGIAENMKQQVQNIWESELPDIINEAALETVPYKQPQIIADIQKQFYQGEEGIVQQEFEITSRGAAQTGKISVKNMESHVDEKAQYGPGQLSSIGSEQEGFLSSVASVSKDDDVSGMSNKIKEAQQQYAKQKVHDDGMEVAIDQSEESDDQGQVLGPTKQQRFDSPFFKSLWKDNDWQKRQTRVVMKQIGLPGNAKMSEIQLEEHIILKAIKDFNTSKFSRDQLFGIEGIINDIFMGSVPPIDLDTNDYSNLKELVLQSFVQHKLDYNIKMETKTYQLFEITSVKQGCIILGSSQSGKTTLVKILETALNKASQNELRLRMAQERKNRLFREADKQLNGDPNAAQEDSKDKKKKKGGRDSQMSVGSAKNQTLQTNFNSTVGGTSSGTGLGGIAGEDPNVKKKKNKRNAAKSRVQQWQEFYKKTKLEPEDIERLKEDLVLRGVESVRINPKSVKQSELFGEINRESYAWSEGLFTHHFRAFSRDTTSTKKWINLDGPIDHEWVENLNSILDDNRKMNLPNGESITLSDGTCLILETDNLRNVTPATISRCGLINIDRNEVNQPKQIFNQYLMRLPPNLQESVKDIENQTNYLMPECLRIFDNEQYRGDLLIPNIDHHWVVNNYVQMLDTFFGGYWIELIKSNITGGDEPSAQATLAKTVNSYSVRTEDILTGEPEQKFDPITLLELFKGSRLTSAIGESTSEFVGKSSDARLANNDFINNESRQENSLKFLPIWSEAFVLISLAWTFGPIFKKRARQQLSDAIKKRFYEGKSDFGTYQKLKKKQQTEKKEEKEEATPGLPTPGSKLIRRNTIMTGAEQPEPSTPAAQLHKRMSLGPKKRLSKNGFMEVNDTGLTTDWNDGREKPLFISDFPFDQFGLFDCFFNLDTNSWTKFDFIKAKSRMIQNFDKMIPTMRLIQNISVPTESSVRNNYMLELLLSSMKPVLIVGEGACGKSNLLKNFIFSEINVFAQHCFTEHITCSHYTNAESLKSNIERNLVTKKLQNVSNKDEMGKTMNSHMFEKKQDSGHMNPPGWNHKLIVYLEDLHMTWKDVHSDQPALEVVRDLLTTRQWYSSTKKGVRVIDGLNMIACMDSKSEASTFISERLLRKFTVIGLEGFDSESAIHIFKTLFEIESSNWPSQVGAHIPKLAKALDTLYNSCFEHLKPTPMKVHYTFNYRECFKFVTSFCKIEGNYLKNEANVVKLFYHEAMRQYADKILMKHDYDWFMDTLKKVCYDCFSLVPEDDEDIKTKGDEEEGEQAKADQEQREQSSTPNATAAPGEEPPLQRQDQMKLPSTKSSKLSQRKISPSERIWPIENPDELWFSILNMEVDGYYCEFKNMEGRNDPIPDVIHQKITDQLEKYNEQSGSKISLILYHELNKHLLKIVRAVNVHDGHLIIVGLKGFGISSLTSLACFVSGVQLNKMELHPNFTDDEWRQEMRKNIIYAASDDKPLAYVCDEYRISSDAWYKDLETLVKSHVCTEITRKSDVMQALISIQKQQKKSLNSLKAMTKEEKENQNKKKEDAEVDVNQFRDARAEIQKDPQMKNDLYFSFLKRVRKNFHLIFNFTPSGNGFREKMEYHKNLMINSQMIWIQNLQPCDLQAIGQECFINVYNEELAAQQVELSGETQNKEQELSYQLQKTKELNEKILQAVIQMYQETCKVAKRFKEDHQHTLYFTPVFFMRTFKTYRSLLKERKQNVETIQKRYDKGLKSIKKTQDAVNAYNDILNRSVPSLTSDQKKLVQVVVDIEEEYQKVKLEREQRKEEQIECQHVCDEALLYKEKCQEELDKIVPCINDAMDSMQQIAKDDVSEVRTLNHPPKTIKLVMKAICLLLGVKPIVKKNSKGVYKPSYWMAAIGPDVLGNPQLPQILLTYDKSQLTQELMGEVEDILTEANYTYESAYKACKTSAGLFRWVKAIRDYYYIFEEMQPRKDALILAEKQHEEKKKALKEKIRQIRDLDEHLKGLKVHQETKQKAIDELKEEIEGKITHQRRAEKLLKGLSAEKQKWIVCTRMLSKKYDTVQGDVLIAAAFITMGSAFTQKYRTKLIQKWQECLKKVGLPCNEVFNFQELYGDNAKMRSWHDNTLPSDTFSTDGALVVDKQQARRYCLLIDPQQLAWSWLRKQHERTSKQVYSMKMSDPNFSQRLIFAIENGHLVIIENISEDPNVYIESLIRREITHYGDKKHIKFCRRNFTYDDQFRMIMLCNLSRPHFADNITNHVCQVNFFVTIEGLTQNLLNLVVANERQDLESSFHENQKATFKNIEMLKVTEEKILKNLSTNVEKILSNEKLIEILNESKKCAETVADKLKKINSTNLFLAKSRQMYAPVAMRAAHLYFAVTELSQVNSMYQYSLKWFMNVFRQTLEKANIMLKKSEVVIDDEEFKLLNSKFSPDERIAMLIKTFTQELIRKIVFSAFQEDRQLLTYYITLKVLQSEELMDPELLHFSLSGSKKIQQDVISPGSQIGIPWMTDLMWAELHYLKNISPFSEESLTEHIMQNPSQWAKIFEMKSLEFKDIPSNKILDTMQLHDGTKLLVPETKPTTVANRQESGARVETNASKKLSRDTGAPDIKGEQSEQARNFTSGSIGQKKLSLGNLQQSKETVDQRLGQSDPNAAFMIREQEPSIQDGRQSQGSANSQEDKATRAGQSQVDQQSVNVSKSKYQEPGGKFFTEAEILADKDLWHVTDSEEESGEEEEQANGEPSPEKTQKAKEDGEDAQTQERQASPSRRYDPYEQNKEYYDDPEALFDEEQQMARYLIEKAPQDGIATHEQFTDLERNTKTERKHIQKKEFILRAQTELALARCIRPDLIQKALHKVVSTIYDFNYINFEVDVLAKFIDPDGTLSLRRQKQAASLQTGRQTDSKKNNAQFFSPPSRRATENNVQRLIQEAYDESSAETPIYFLVTHSINVYDELTTFYSKKAAQQGIKLNHIQIGRGTDNKIDKDLNQAMQGGEWVLIENLHLADDLLPQFEQILTTLDKENTNNRFRIFISSVQMDNCPHMILKQSIKVALQQPTGVKLKMESAIDKLETEPIWRKGQYVNLHKNLYFALSYLYAVLDGRKIYGPLGWNIYMGFDASDFSISEAQIKAILNAGIEDKDSAIHMIKYLFSNINFAGKISRNEDQRKLDAIIEDLIAPDIANCALLPANPTRGHYGFPVSSTKDMCEWVTKNLPIQDSAEIYGFNKNTERAMLGKKSLDIMMRLYFLNRTKIVQQKLGYEDLEKNLETTSLKISLAKSSLHTQSQNIQALDQYKGDVSRGDISPVMLPAASVPNLSMPGEVEGQMPRSASLQYYNTEALDSNSADSLLPLFVQIQKLLKHSSLDESIKLDSDRFDEKVDSHILPQRDINDKRVSACAAKIRDVLKGLIHERSVIVKFPYSNMRPLHNIYAIEIRRYIKLLAVIQRSVEDLIEHIDGQYMRPLEIERLWHQIQKNIIPRTWRPYSFQTAFSSLADFIVELVERVKFWEKMLKVNAVVPALWIPAFYDPNQFMNALKQKMARTDKIPARMIKNTFEVTKIYEPSLEDCPQILNVAYLYGLWIQGAEWDAENKLLVEPTSSHLYMKFPVIKVLTQRKEIGEADVIADDEFEDNPQPSKRELKRMQEAQKRLEEEAEQAEIVAEQQALANISRAPSLKNDDSNYNFKKGQDAKTPAEPVSPERRGSRLANNVSGLSRDGSSSPLKNNNSKMESKQGSALEKMQIAEVENSNDNENSDSEEEEKRLYTYNCPVFRTTLRLQTGEISSDNKPVFYIDLQSYVHPRQWVKRSVALLMETGR